LQHDAGVAVVEEVEAAVDPEALLVDGDVCLRVYGPVAGLGDGAADFWVDFGRHYCFVLVVVVSGVVRGGVEADEGMRWAMLLVSVG
jgi:hypothetical protein